MADKPEFGHIEIEVVYALPGAQAIVTLIVPAGTTVATGDRPIWDRYATSGD